MKTLLLGAALVLATSPAFAQTWYHSDGSVASAATGSMNSCSSWQYPILLTAAASSPFAPSCEGTSRSSMTRRDISRNGGYWSKRNHSPMACGQQPLDASHYEFPMTRLLIAAALLLAASPAQAGLQGPDRTSFVQAFIARCAAVNTRYPAQAAWNYCNCGAQRAADMITPLDVANHRSGRWGENSSHWVVACKAKYLK